MKDAVVSGIIVAVVTAVLTVLGMLSYQYLTYEPPPKPLSREEVEGIVDSRAPYTRDKEWVRESVSANANAIEKNAAAIEKLADKQAEQSAQYARIEAKLDLLLAQRARESE